MKDFCGLPQKSFIELYTVRVLFTTAYEDFCGFLHLIFCAYSRGLCGRSATSIVAAYSRSFRLRRFASPLEKQSRLWRPVNSNQRFEYDRLVRGHNSRHWRESAHLPLDSFTAPLQATEFLLLGFAGGFPVAPCTPSGAPSDGVGVYRTKWRKASTSLQGTRFSLFQRALRSFRNLNRRGLQPLVSVEKVCFSVGEAKSPVATGQFKSKI